MKIMYNGVIRDMTPEEEARFIADHEAMIPPWADVEVPDNGESITTIRTA